MTLLKQLEAAERELRTHMASRPGSAFYPGQQPEETLRRQAEVDAAHTARTAALSALCAAAAARCMVSVEDVTAAPEAPFISRMYDPTFLANTPAPRPRDDEPAWCCDSARLADPHPCPWHSGDLDPVTEINPALRRAGEFLADPLAVARSYGVDLVPVATVGSPVASHGVEHGRFAVIHWAQPGIPALRLDLEGDPIR